MPDLEPGDYVEFEYVDPASPPGAFPRGFLAERFFFRSYDAPLYRSEYVVATPPEMKLQVDRRGEGVPADARRARARPRPSTPSPRRCSRRCSPSRRRRRSPSSCRRCAWPRGCRRKRGRTTSSTGSCWRGRANRELVARGGGGDARCAQRRRQDARRGRLGAQAHQGRRRGARRGRDVDPGARRGQSHHARRGALGRGRRAVADVAGASASATRSSTARCPISKASTSRSWPRAACGSIRAIATPRPASCRRRCAARARSRWRRGRCRRRACRRRAPTIGRCSSTCFCTPTAPRK